jgi:site-specific recombinase XerC
VHGRAAGLSACPRPATRAIGARDVARDPRQQGEALQQTGLYREIKAIFAVVADGLQAREPAKAMLLRAASPHWLRHAYARTLVVDHQVPLPAAQALLGHASVQTTAAYAKTDLTQLRAFVDATFADDVP